MSLSALLPVEPAFYLVGLTATFLIALGKGAFGGGLAILGVPLLALVMEPLDAAIVTAVLVVAMDVLTIRSFGWARMSRPDLRILAPALVAGIALGWFVFVYVDPRWVTLGIGLITLAFTAHWFIKGAGTAQAARPPEVPAGVLAGSVAGFTTFVAHAGGPPLAMYLLRRGLDKSVYAATMSGVFVIGNLFKLPPYVQLGLQDPKVLVASAALLPAVPLGVWTGRRLHDRLPQRQLYIACYTLLAVAALNLTWDAVRALG